MLQELTGIAGAVATAAGAAFYLHGIYKNRIHPHAISWFLWTVLTTIATFAQASDNAGPGAWVMAASAVCCGIIFVASLRKTNEVVITKSDWLALAGAALAMPVWYATDNALTAIIIVTCIDLAGYIPTFRKSYWKPHQEGLILYGFVVLKAALSIVATEHISWTTILYPASVMVFSSVFIALMLARRKKLGLYPT